MSDGATGTICSVIKLSVTGAPAWIEAEQREAASGWGGGHPVWGGRGWKVFLEPPDDIRRTGDSIERKPDPPSMPRQAWPFVSAYDGWPLRPMHSPNSPYAKRLRAAGRYP